MGGAKEFGKSGGGAAAYHAHRAAGIWVCCNKIWRISANFREIFYRFCRAGTGFQPPCQDIIANQVHAQESPSALLKIPNLLKAARLIKRYLLMSACPCATQASLIPRAPRMRLQEMGHVTAQYE